MINDQLSMVFKQQKLYKKTINRLLYILKFCAVYSVLN